MNGIDFYEITGFKDQEEFKMSEESGLTTEDYSRISWLAKTTETPSHWKWPTPTIYSNVTEFPVR